MPHIFTCYPMGHGHGGMALARIGARRGSPIASPKLETQEGVKHTSGSACDFGHRSKSRLGLGSNPNPNPNPNALTLTLTNPSA